MEENKLNKKKKTYRLISILISVIILSVIWNHFSNEPKKEVTTIKNETSTSSSTKESETEESIKPFTVWYLGEKPFNNDDTITFKKITTEELGTLNKPSIVIAGKNYIKENYQNDFIKLSKSKHTILFYDKELVPEDVVLLFKGEIPVVTVDSSIPLKFQAYGISTIDGKLMPIFVSATSEQTKLNEESFKELFKQIVQKQN